MISGESGSCGQGPRFHEASRTSQPADIRACLQRSTSTLPLLRLLLLLLMSWRSSSSLIALFTSQPVSDRAYSRSSQLTYRYTASSSVLYYNYPIGNVLYPNNKVTLHRIQLVPVQVSVCRQLNHLDM